MQRYHLMHKDVICGQFDYDETTGRMADYYDGGTGFSPFLGNADNNRMKKWWEMRAVPASRAAMIHMIKEHGCLNAGSYLAKNLALSMTDSYWICPVDIQLQFHDVKLYNTSVYTGGKIPYHNATSYDPNASLGGQMEKYWDVSGRRTVLVKESYKYYGQQAVNEVFATKLHEMQQTNIPFVSYLAEKTEDRGILCKCDAFTSEQIEFISAYEILESRKLRNDRSLYDQYIAICTEHGIDKEQIQQFMDYQTLTDFILTNTDEHLNNFGVLRDSDSMELIGPAPIFDSGNSMFYSDSMKIPYSRVEILQQKVSTFYSEEAKVLTRVHNKKIVKEDLLPDRKMILELYTVADIPEWKAEVIADNYMTKRKMLLEFQHGQTISLYREKQKQKEENAGKGRKSEEKLVVVYGVSDCSKPKKADKIAAQWRKSGMQEITGEEVYSIKQAYEDTRYIVDQQQVMKKLPVFHKTHAYVVVSELEIINELKMQAGAERRLLSYVMAIRTAQALRNGISVICETSLPLPAAREVYWKLAKNAGLEDENITFSINSDQKMDE